MTHTTSDTVGHFIQSDEYTGKVVAGHLPRPPFIEQPEDANSVLHIRQCLAWWLISRKTHVQINAFVATQTPNAQAQLRPALDKCYAWVWLLTLKSSDIRTRLHALQPDKKAAFTEHLNALRSAAKQAKNAQQTHPIHTSQCDEYTTEN